MKRIRIVFLLRWSCQVGQALMMSRWDSVVAGLVLIVLGWVVFEAEGSTG